MYIKPSHSLNNDSFIMGLSTDDLAGTIMGLMILKNSIGDQLNGILMILISLFTLASLSFVRINYRKKIIVDCIKFIFLKIFSERYKI